MFSPIIQLIEHPDQFENLQTAYTDAYNALEDYLKEDSQNKEALELKVKVSNRLHKYNVSKQTAKTLLMLGGEESMYLELYGQSLLQTGDFEGAESDYMRAYKLDPDSNFMFGVKYKQVKELNKIKKEGNEKVSQGKYEEAINMYTMGIERSKSFGFDCEFIFLNNRAACYMNTKRFEEALQDIDTSLNQNPYLTKSYLRKIKCIKTLNKVDRFNELPLCYVNALFVSGYKESGTKTLCNEYIQFLRGNKAFKSNVRGVGSENELNRALSNNPDALIVLDIYASWCGPCKKLAPILDELSVSHPSVIFLKIDGDKERGVSSRFRIDGFPTILMIRNTKVVNKVVGYDPEGIENAINSMIEIPQDTLYN